MTPPTKAGWSLALRFLLEVVALVGFAAAAWRLVPGSDPGRWVAALAAPVAVAAVWGVFAVLDDPSRSGAAPVEVPGLVRLAIELTILGGGAAAIGFVTRPAFGMVVALAIVGHHLTSLGRIAWLVRA